MCKIMLEVEYFFTYKNYNLSNVKIFQKNSLFHLEMIWLFETKEVNF